MGFVFNPFTGNLDKVNSSALENPVDYIDFNTMIDVAHQEGRLHWSNDDGTLEVGMPGGNVSIQLGQELSMRATNKHGSQINNGQASYITGASGSNPEMELANASNSSGIKTLAVATENIGNNQKGFFTTFGLVRDMDTSFGNDGDEVFLDAVDGGLTVDKLDYPNVRTRVGYILRSHANEGVLFVNINSDTWLKRMQAQGEPTGFSLKPELSNLLGDISFDESSRTFTIEPQSGEEYFSFWSNAQEYRRTSESVVIDDTEGVHFIYYDNTQTLISSTTPWSFGSGLVLVAIVYWDSTNKKGVLGEERHGITMDWATHAYLHQTNGATYVNGFTPSLIVDASGADNEDAEMQSITSGFFYDEDISHNNLEQTNYEIWYKDGASNWRWDDASPSLVKMGATTPYYNEEVGGNWQLTAVTNNDYFLMHIFATNRAGNDNKIILVMGENQYETKTQARDGALTEITNLTTGSLPTPEFIEIASVILQVKTTYGNDYNARVVSTDEGGDFVDFRRNDKIGVGASVSHHGNLTGLLDDDHTQYLLTDGTRNVSGDLRGPDFVNTTGGVITRDVNGDVSTIALNNRTITITRTDGLITSYTDGINTWTINRVDDLITSWDVT